MFASEIIESTSPLARSSLKPHPSSIMSPDKDTAVQFETVEDGAKIDVHGPYGLVKSRYDELSIPRTLWVFKRVILISLAVYTGYVCEGFEVSLFSWSVERMHAKDTALTRSSSALAAASLPTPVSSSSSGIPKARA